MAINGAKVASEDGRGGCCVCPVGVQRLNHLILAQLDSCEQVSLITKWTAPALL